MYGAGRGHKALLKLKIFFTTWGNFGAFLLPTEKQPSKLHLIAPT